MVCDSDGGVKSTDMRGVFLCGMDGRRGIQSVGLPWTVGEVLGMDMARVPGRVVDLAPRVQRCMRAQCENVWRELFG